jgi:deoxyribodipyrimidine photo-lyase
MLLGILTRPVPACTWIACRRAAPAVARRRLAAMSQPQPGELAIVWFRAADLRLADHEPLCAAIRAEPAHLVPFFCVDDGLLQPRAGAALGLPSTGPHKLRALLQALRGLRAALQQRGSDLLCPTAGSAAAVVAQLVEAATAAAAAAAAAGGTQPSAVRLHYYEGMGAASVAEEDAVEAALHAAAARHGAAASAHRHWGHSLYHPHDFTPSLLQPDEGTAAAPLRPSDGISTAADARINTSGRRFAGMAPGMTAFRRALQAETPVRRPLAAPGVLPALPPALAGVALGRATLDLDTASLEGVYAAAGASESVQRLAALVGASAAASFGLDSPALSHPMEDRTQIPFEATEEAALQRLRYFLGLASTDGHGTRAAGAAAPIADYKEARMMAGGVDSSAKLAVFLSLGCISPRTVYWQAVDALQQAGGEGAGAGPAAAAAWRWREPDAGSPGAAWLLMHLGIRDFFLFCALRDGERIYDAGGPRGVEAPWRADGEAFAAWAAGATGLPFVDASMRELAATGYTSNRGRQNAASLLAKALSLDWRLGAELFQALLACHDAALNWQNWAYVAGVGADPRPDRAFKVVTQGERYDPGAALAAAWLPELRGLPPVRRHRPWEEDLAEGAGPKVYPGPIVDPATQIAKGPRR